MMTDVMYELPSRNDVHKCIVTKETVERVLCPILVADSESRKRHKNFNIHLRRH